MGKLAEWLRDEVARRGVRGVVRDTGVAAGTISRLMNEQNQGRPELETLVKLSQGLGQPLANLVAWAGDPLGLPDEDDALLARLRAEAGLDPQLAEILRLLQDAPEQDRRAVLTYLRGALGSRQ